MNIGWKAFALALAATIVVVFQSQAPAQTHKLVDAKDGSGVFGYKYTPIQPWSGYHVHDPDRPAPKKVDPGKPSTLEKAGTAPSDAVVLFDGKDLSAWHPSNWKVEDGDLVATHGPLTTNQ